MNVAFSVRDNWLVAAKRSCHLSCIGIVGLSVNNRVFSYIIQVILDAGAKCHRVTWIPDIAGSIDVESSMLRQELDHRAHFTTVYVITKKNVDQNEFPVKEILYIIRQPHTSIQNVPETSKKTRFISLAHI